MTNTVRGVVCVVAVVVSTVACEGKYSSPLAPDGPGPGGLTVVTVGLPAATAGFPYAAELQAAGGQPPYKWSAEATPDGLAVSEDGRVMGAVIRCGGTSPTVRVRVTDGSGGSAARNLTMPCGYEPLGVPHYPSGVDLPPMWIKLVAINPPRDSLVRDTSNCDSGCLTFTVEARADDGRGGYWFMYDSDDGVNPSSQSYASGGISWEGPKQRNLGPWRFTSVPRFLLFRLERDVYVSGKGFVTVGGWTSFATGFKLG